MTDAASSSAARPTTDAELAPWHENGPRMPSARVSWRGLWHARDLVFFFALRDIRILYKQATLGVIWVLLQPIFTVAVFTLVFSRLAGLSSDGIPYPLFALVGAVTWTYFSTASSRASTVLVANPELVTKVSFPRMAAPASAMLPPLLDIAVTTVLVVPLFVYYDTTPSWQIVAAPAWLALLVLTTFGISLWLSALNVRFRDIQAALGPALQVWLFASPVAYSTSELEGWRQLVYSLNPVVGVIDLGRWSVLGAPWPGWSLAVSLTVSAVILVTGVRHFRRSARVFADVI